MSKSSRSRAGRDTPAIASTRVLPRLPDSSGDRLPALSALDRRSYVPSPPSSPLSRPYRPAVLLSGRPARFIAKPNKPAYYYGPQRLSWQAVGFRAPKQVAICVRRGVRKEVLFARKVAGRRGLAGGRRNEFSNIRC